MKNIIIVLFGLLLISCDKGDPKPKMKSPKLVVGIVVDQMRYDYLTRFDSKYGKDGFKRFMKDGFHCDAHHFSYMPTYTGPGHASVFSGTTPKIHGIIANDWFDRKLNRYVYCVEDTTVVSVGGDFIKENRSPRNMLVTGIADQVKLQTNQKGKTIGISIKDRAAILPAGKMADAAYWFKGGKDGIFITSTYYMNSLPKWVKEFNDKNLPKKYISKNWKTIFPIDQYTESGPDNNPHEESLKGEGDPVFPYDLSKIFDKIGYNLMKETPFGNDLLVEFAKEAIRKEDLGKDNVVDFLSVSFSSPDYIGHSYGPNSVEIEDTYIRLDQSLEEFFKFLDKKVGKGEYTVFLTADHGVAQIPNDLKNEKVEVGYYNSKEMFKIVDSTLNEMYGVKGLIRNFSNFQFFINYDKADLYKIPRNTLQENILEIALKLPGVKSGLTRKSLETYSYGNGVEKKVQQGWNTQKSGDVAIVMEPGWLSSKYDVSGGTGHGSPWNYDTHVPLLFYGFGINKGGTHLHTSVEDIVPTIAAVIGLQAPMGATGSPIDKVVRK